MMDDREKTKVFYDFYEAVKDNRHWNFIRVPKNDAFGFWLFCFNEAIAGRMTGRREECAGTELAKLFLLGYQSATGKQIIQRIERVYFNSVGDMKSD